MSARREALVLVGSVVIVDLVFIAAYFLGHIDRSSSGMKLGFTIVWTLITLLVVLRGLVRIRKARVQGG
jgi:hypothetical protein